MTFLNLPIVVMMGIEIILLRVLILSTLTTGNLLPIKSLLNLLIVDLLNNNIVGILIGK